MKIKIINAAALESGGICIKILISDGEHSERKSLVVSEEDFADLGLCAGADLSTDVYEQLDAAAEHFEAVRRGIYLLSYGANSRQSLAIKLRRRGYDKQLAEDVAGELYRRGYINECADAEGVIRACLARKYGKKRIIAKLHERGYDNEVIFRAFDNFGEIDYTANCAELIRKKYKYLPEERAELDKLIGALVRYGYSYGEIKGALEICNS